MFYINAILYAHAFNSDKRSQKSHAEVSGGASDRISAYLRTLACWEQREYYTY